MSKKYTHTHKYERRKLGSWKKTGHDIYKCALPGCSHYIVDLELVVGKYSCCWGVGCTNEVEMTRYLVFNEKRKWPICESCKLEKRLQKDGKLDDKLRRIERMAAELDANAIDS